MSITIFEYICKNFNYLAESLDNKFFFNIFFMLNNPELLLIFNGLTFQKIVNFIVLNLHYIINITLLIYIIFCLLKNMFDFSI